MDQEYRGREEWRRQEPEAGENHRFLDRCEALRAEDPVARRQAARDLQAHGETALEPLCAALADEELEVRLAAAEALGHIGDSRALQPLTGALQACFVGGSARRQLVSGLLILLAGLLLMCGVLIGSALLKTGGIFWIFIHLGRAIARSFEQRRTKSRLCGAITDALTRIAEQNPTPEVRALVPEFRAVAADSLQQDRATRDLSRRSAARIEALTEKLKDLPVSAAAPGQEVAALPTPAEAPQLEASRLPRVGS